MFIVGISKYSGILWESSIKCILNHHSFDQIYKLKLIFMSSKTTRIIYIILMIIPSLMLIMSAVMKLIAAEPVVTGLSASGLGNYITLFGIVELISVALFLYQKTYKIGFLLLCSYLGKVYFFRL